MRARGVAGSTSRIVSVRISGLCYRMARGTLLRRARGALLRFVRHRSAAALAGAAFFLPAAWVELHGGSSIWWVNGLALVFAAIGLALLWTELTGVPADWEEPPEQR